MVTTWQPTCFLTFQNPDTSDPYCDLGWALSSMGGLERYRVFSGLPNDLCKKGRTPNQTKWLYLNLSRKLGGLPPTINVTDQVAYLVELLCIKLHPVSISQTRLVPKEIGVYLFIYANLVNFEVYLKVPVSLDKMVEVWMLKNLCLIAQ